TLLFEPNLVPGFANRMVARWASAAAVQFEETRGRFRNAVVTGVPVRQEFFAIPPRPANAPPALLVFGGSQGAGALNRVMMESAAALKLAGLSVIHQTGERDYNQAKAAYQQSGLSAEVTPFIDRMPEAFARADLLLCRSGASTVAEVVAAGKPAIFVPFPRASDDHQRRNAEALVAAGAAVLIPEAELTSAHLMKTVGELLADKKRLGEMSAAARKLAHPDAAEETAQMAARLAGVAKQ
nr:UDP-N-acetylglucosamine--N-acetylmuramyl-(pentapeptide) pyrophosphoryl-undecaprenol N-acetylglucosamine transferase [Acidobacteriota bacterium]